MSLWPPRLILCILLFSLVTLLAAPAAADDLPCDIRVVEGGVQCVDAHDEIQWNIKHPALWGQREDFRRDADALKPVNPIQLDEALFYAVRRDLLQVDPAAGTVEHRARFPAPIVDISPDGDELEVTVEAEFEQLPDYKDHSEQVTIPYRPGAPSPPQYIWSAPLAKDIFLPQYDADWRPQRAGDEQHAIEQLKQARDTDPTNPFLSLVLGELFNDKGEREAAERAFEQAAESPAVWRDLLAVSSRLETAGAEDEADLAFRRGLQKMEKAGVSQERLISMLPMVTTLMMPQGEDSPVHEALMAGDAEAVDRLVQRFAEIAPYVESGSYNWEALANWMADQGEDALADKWQQIADENRRYAYDVYTASVVQIDRAILALISLIAALVILAFLIGMRGGVARRRDGAEGERVRWWMPRVRVRDLIVPAVMFVALFAIPFVINVHADVVDNLANAPISAGQDGLASPQTITWLEEMSGGDQLDNLLSTALAELDALQRGEELTDREPIAAGMVDALYENARTNQLELLRQGRMPDFIATARAAQHDPAAFEAPPSVSLLFAGAPLVVLLFIGLAGAFIGARFPKFSRTVLVVLPGGSERLAPLGALALVAIIAAAAAFAGFDNILYQMTQPAFLDYFGLQSIEEFAPTPSRVWAWAALSAALIFQAALVGWQLLHHRKRRSDS